MTQKPEPNLINTTPHDIVFVEGEGVVARLPRAIRPVRIERVFELHDQVHICGATVDVVVETVGALEAMPDPSDDTMFVVSSPVAAVALHANPRRRDLLVPEDLVRDAGGAVVGCRRLRLVLPPG